MSHPAVLYVEDDPNDMRLMRYAWARVGVRNPLQIAIDGEEAVRYLCGTGRYGNRTVHPMPSLLLVDLKLPKMSGFDVLRWLRSQPTLQTMRVIALSSSRLPSDMSSARALWVDAYLVKPILFDEWVALVDSLKASWLGGG